MCVEMRKQRRKSFIPNNHKSIKIDNLTNIWGFFYWQITPPPQVSTNTHVTTTNNDENFPQFRFVCVRRRRNFHKKLLSIAQGSQIKKLFNLILNIFSFEFNRAVVWGLSMWGSSNLERFVQLFYDGCSWSFLFSFSDAELHFVDFFENIFLKCLRSICVTLPASQNPLELE